MPCWYFEKKEIKNTPSYKDGIDSFTEARYRREGARFIIDAGTKMGLRYDTCATGVVYFHRFYMFHSFKEFHRYITAACCLFLAGKVEETPKKCKDIIKICQNLLSPTLFTVFGDDPKEEVMTMERILLQTIKFDLQVDHPYGALLKFAKVVKGDREKIQKLVQMAWTFINDSLCTTLCLQWEPEITAVSLMYLATRLTKFDIQDWNGKTPGSKVKWWEFLVEDITVELMEDICHRVLDLYSNNPPTREESPPVTPSKKGGARDTPPPPPPAKRSAPNTPAESGLDNKVQRMDSQSRQETPSRAISSSSNSKAPPPPHPSSHQPSADSATKSLSQSSSHGQSSSQPSMSKPEQSSMNPYMSSQMYSSSFMSQEGSKSIQTLMGGGQEGVASANPPPVTTDMYGNMQSMTQQQQQPPPAMGQYPAQTGQYPTPQYPQGMYPQVSATTPYQQQPAYAMQQTAAYPNVASQPYNTTAAMPAAPVQTQGYQTGTYPQNYPQQPQMQPFMQQYQHPPQNPAAGYNQVPQQTFNQGQMPQGQQHFQQQQQQQRPPNPRLPMNNAPRGPRMQQSQNAHANTNSGLTVRISGRR